VSQQKVRHCCESAWVQTTSCCGNWMRLTFRANSRVCRRCATLFVSTIRDWWCVDRHRDSVLRRLSAGEGYVYCIYLKNNVKAGTEKCFPYQEHNTSIYKLHKMPYFLWVELNWQCGWYVWCVVSCHHRVCSNYYTRKWKIKKKIPYLVGRVSTDYLKIDLCFFFNIHSSVHRSMTQ